MFGITSGGLHVLYVSCLFGVTITRRASVTQDNISSVQDEPGLQPDAPNSESEVAQQSRQPHVMFSECVALLLAAACFLLAAAAVTATGKGRVGVNPYPFMG